MCYGICPGKNPCNPLSNPLKLQILCPPHRLPFHIIQWNSMPPSKSIVTVFCNYWSWVLRSNPCRICPLSATNSEVPLFPSYLDWLLSSHTWVGRKHQPKNSRSLPIMPKTMLLNNTLHPCHLKCPPLLTSSSPGMLLLPKSHNIPFFPLKLSHPWKWENSIRLLQVHHPHARPNQPAQNQTTRKMTLVSTVKQSTGTASFIKTNDKIRDQLLNCFACFFDLMHANINGPKIHPISTKKPLPILTSP
jgi:hypothetical protein